MAGDSPEPPPLNRCRRAGYRLRRDNLSPDHLDLHGTLDRYYTAKASLFTPGRCEQAVVNIGGPHGRRLAAETRCPLTTFTTGPEPADWSARIISADSGGTRFRLCGPGVGREVRLRLPGTHQADNAVAALVALATGGVNLHAALRGIENLASVPGRLERIDAGQPFRAFVDFAHNTGGQRRLLPFLRSLTDGRVVVVLGAAGERDPRKRDALGDTAARGADLVTVTDESAHSENPAMLRDAVAAGARRSGQVGVHVEPDRHRALLLAVSTARPGDIVVITGRGADQRQTSNSGSHPFDDRTALRHALLQQTETSRLDGSEQGTRCAGPRGDASRGDHPGPGSSGTDTLPGEPPMSGVRPERPARTPGGRLLGV